MKKLTILVDMDGTIENLPEEWISELNSRYHQHVQPEDIKEWDMHKAYPMLSRDQIFSILEEPSLWEAVKPKEGAAEVLKRFIDAGHRVYIVTTAALKTVSVKTEHQLFRNFPFIRWKDVIVIHQKQLLTGDVMIDDAVHNLTGGAYRKILVDAPYNRDADDEKEGFIRVKNWDEIEKAVRQIAEEWRE